MTGSHTLVLLQNAWSPFYAGQEWPRESWLRALQQSRSGKRLAQMFVDTDAIWFDNTTPKCGDSPDSVLPIDKDHVLKLLLKGPKVVIACGKQAAKASQRWMGFRILIPHPASRLVTNHLFDVAREEWAAMLKSEGKPYQVELSPLKSKRVSRKIL